MQLRIDKRVMTLIVLLTAGVSCFSQAQNQNFGTWDEDGDGYINDTEFETGVDNEGYFDLYDSNTDGMIDDAEWRTAKQTNDYLEQDHFSGWDADQDGFLYEDEFYSGAYNTWDSNKDGQIEPLEYDNNYADWHPY